MKRIQNISGVVQVLSKPTAVDEENNPTEFRQLDIFPGCVLSYQASTIVGAYLDAQLNEQDWEILQ